MSAPAGCFELGKLSCPSCRAGATHAQATSGVEAPRPGDLNVCFYCGAPSQFTDDLGLRSLSSAELAALDPRDQAAVRNAQQQVADLRGRSHP